MNCLFCKIVEGSIPSQKVYEDDKVLGFKDVTPQSPHHYLFIPKEHVDSLAALDLSKMNLMTDLFSAVRKVADKEKLSEQGFRTVINTNKYGGQTVFHLHVHLIGGKQLGGNMAGV